MKHEKVAPRTAVTARGAAEVPDGRPAQNYSTGLKPGEGRLLLGILGLVVWFTAAIL